MAYIKIKRPDIGYLSSFPTYIEFTKEDQYIQIHDPLGPHFIDTAYPWATWHPRNSRFRHQRACFDVIMKFNSLGTRGKLPNSKNTNNVLFIGDSFTEGFGLPEDSTLPEMVSKKMGKPVLNLGSTGHVGTTQFALIYEHFSKLFKHNEVYVLLFLRNDIVENRIPRNGDSEPEKYRPYRADTGNLSRIFYTGSLERNRYSWETYRTSIRNGQQKVKIGMRNLFSSKEFNFFTKLTILTYSARMLYSLKKSARLESSIDIAYTKSDLKILDYDLQFISDLASRSGAKVTFINLPDMSLLNRSLNDPGSDKPYLELERHISDLVDSGPHRFLSFYSYFIGTGIDPRSIFFECDPHYNAKGMEVLADFISKNWRRKI
jgi:hypothetical protein